MNSLSMRLYTRNSEKILSVTSYTRKLRELSKAGVRSSVSRTKVHTVTSVLNERMTQNVSSDELRTYVIAEAN